MNQLTDCPVSLHEMLNRKEARVKQQREWLRRHSRPIVSFTVNMPGPVKMNHASRTVMKAGLDAIKEACNASGWKVLGIQKCYENTGPEAIFSIDISSATLLKKAMMTIERRHPLGRLMDLDVLDVSGNIISRRSVNLPARRCLLCEQDAVICARSRRHDLASLLEKIEEITNDYECCA